MPSKPWLVVALVGALAGFGFATLSTYDFEQHLDRRVHDVHCSFVPGVSDDEGGSSGCETTLMSTYSSVYRSWVWGGIPISLPAMSVFAFLLFFGVDLWLTDRDEDIRATGFYFAAALLPVGASLVMAYIALGVLDAACKLCIGIYIASGLVFIGASGLFFRKVAGGGTDRYDAGEPYGEDPAWAMDEEGADSEPDVDQQEDVSWETGDSGGGDGPIRWSKLVGAFGLGCLFVAVPTAAYVATVPDHSKFVGKCGYLEEEPDSELLIDLPGGDDSDAVPALEVFDPLCPACRGFEDHLEKTRFEDELDRRAVLFPLDDACNWMLDTAVHPGACKVSRAVLCADNRADRVIDWAFSNQEKIRKAAKEDDEAVARMIEERFPELASCVDAPRTKKRLNRSLEWAVENKIKVLTPQFFVAGARLCDEDVDLGLEYALDRMVEMHREGTLKSTAIAAEKEEEEEEE